MTAADRANQEMVDRLIAQEALWSPRLIAAFRQTPRHRFLERIHQHARDGSWREVDVTPLGPSEIALVYSDRALTTRLSPASSEAAPVAISSSSQPSLMAQMLEDLRPAPGLRTLEVGAGTGYNAALLAHVVGPGQVVSVDVDRDVLAEAERHLANFSERAVRVVHADGRDPLTRLLLLAGGPLFDRIMVTAATPDLEPAWLEQLAPGGLLVAPLVLGPGLSFVVRGTVRNGVFRGRLTRPAYFMPLRAERETGTGDSAGLSDPGPLEVFAAPWVDWSNGRRTRLGTRGLVLSLAFYGLLHGLSVSCQAQGDATLFGLSDLVRGCACWVGPQRWHVSGSAGRALGESLWRAFLDAGAPWPTEFDLFADPRVRLTLSGRETYTRRGPRCQHVWRLREKRERPTVF
ncbi:MAG: methyltransferase domain-containing protein [Planctomycetes bacterium]|nr:methyltransferase domain-containing protein [Planctomycetota bacterium]